MRGYLIALATAGSLLSGAAAIAAPADTIAARQKNFKAIGRNFKAVGDALKQGEQPAAIRGNTRELADLAAQLPRWFPAGTGPQAGVKTAALPAIWQKPADFAAAAAAFAKASRNLNAVAATGNMEAVAAAYRQTGATCKGCHDNFKAKDD